MNTVKDFFTELLSGEDAYQTGIQFWNSCVKIMEELLGVSPQKMGQGTAWKFVSGNLYQLYLALGMSLMTLYWLINFCRENANFKEKLTLEKTFVSLLQLIAANILLANLLKYIGIFFDMASGLSTMTVDLQLEKLESQKVEFSGLMSYYILGILFEITAFACGFFMIYAIYRRFLRLYLLIPLGPIALSGIAGGRGISTTAWSWIRCFLCLTFELVIIGLALGIGQMMLQSEFAQDIFQDERWNALFFMLVITGTAKGAETLLAHAFGLWGKL